jgi:hypothetical protein
LGHGDDTVEYLVLGWDKVLQLPTRRVAARWLGEVVSCAGSSVGGDGCEEEGHNGANGAGGGEDDLGGASAGTAGDMPTVKAIFSVDGGGGQQERQNP